MDDTFDRPPRIPRALPSKVKGDLRPPVFHLRRKTGHTQRSISDELGIEQTRYYRYELPVTHESYCVMPVHIGRRFLRVLREFDIENVTLDDLYHPFLQ